MRLILAPLLVVLALAASASAQGLADNNTWTGINKWTRGGPFKFTADSSQILLGGEDLVTVPPWTKQAVLFSNSQHPVTGSVAQHLGGAALGYYFYDGGAYDQIADKCTGGLAVGGDHPVRAGVNGNWEFRVEFGDACTGAGVAVNWTPGFIASVTGAGHHIFMNGLQSSWSGSRAVCMDPTTREMTMSATSSCP